MSGTCKRSLEVLASSGFGPCRKVSLKQVENGTWGGRVVEGKKVAPQRRPRCAALAALLNSCASGQRSI